MTDIYSDGKLQLPRLALSMTGIIRVIWSDIINRKYTHFK